LTVTVSNFPGRHSPHLLSRRHNTRMECELLLR
jgi:hypothetical protein